MIKIYKTSEISAELWERVVEGFNECFEAKTTVKKLQDFYTATVFGYSYHAIDFDEDGTLRGYNSFVPYEYEHKDQILKVCLSGGTYVRKQFRKDVFIFMNLVNELFAHCKADGFAFKVGVPNKNSFKYAVKINKAKIVGYLPYYVLPYKMLDYFNEPFLKLFNFIPVLFAWLLWGLSYIISLFYNPKAKKREVEMHVSDKFLGIRFGNEERYVKCRKGNLLAYYRVYEENRGKIAYIMDFRENGTKSLKSLLFAVSNIMKQHSEVTMISYIGTMTIFESILFRLPDSKVPHPFPLTINVLDKKKLETDKLLSMDSWDFSLMNFDVR
jgi:hypothetical protein